MAARITTLLLSASTTVTALQVPARRAGSVAPPKTLRFVEVADRIQTSEDKAETFETADYLQDMDRYEGKNNVIPTGFDVNAAIDAAATESTTFIDVVVEETVAKVAEERKDEVAADAVASVEKKLETKLDETMEKIEAAAVPMEGEQALVEVGVHGRGLQPVGRGAELGRVRVLELARHLVRVRVRARVRVSV